METREQVEKRLQKYVSAYYTSLDMYIEAVNAGNEEEIKAYNVLVAHNYAKAHVLTEVLEMGEEERKNLFKGGE